MCQRALPGTRVEGEHRLGCTRQLVPLTCPAAAPGLRVRPPDVHQRDRVREAEQRPNSVPWLHVSTARLLSVAPCGRLCTRTCAHTCMCTHIHTHVCTCAKHTCMHTVQAHIHVCPCTQKQLHMHMQAGTRVCMRAWICTCAHTHPRTYACVHKYMHAHTHTYTYGPWTTRGLRHQFPHSPKFS